MENGIQGSVNTVRVYLVLDIPTFPDWTVSFHRKFVVDSHVRNLSTSQGTVGTFSFPAG